MDDPVVEEAAPEGPAEPDPRPGARGRHLGARRRAARDRRRQVDVHERAPAADLRVRRPAPVPRDPRRGGPPRQRRGGPGRGAGVREGRRAVGRPRRRLGAVGRRAADLRRRADRGLAHEARARDRPRQPPHLRGAGRHQREHLGDRRAGLLLPARPVEPDRLLDRRQRRRELRRRALLQVRLHHQLRDRARGGAPRRRDDPHRRLRARPSRLRPARRVRRLRGHARRRHQGVAARRPVPGDRQDAGRVLRHHARGGRGGVRRSCRPGSCRARSR